MLKPWSNGKAIQRSWTEKFATESLRLGWNKNWTGATEVQWVNTSWKELRWEERDERKVEERCQNLRQELRSSGKMMEVRHSSYRQNLFLDPIALHFLNLETSATRLARDLLVWHDMIFLVESCSWPAMIGNPCILSKNYLNYKEKMYTRIRSLMVKLAGFRAQFSLVASPER